MTTKIFVGINSSLQYLKSNVSICLLSENLPLNQGFPSFLCSRHLYLVFFIFGGTLAGLIGIKIKGLWTLAASLSQAHGTPAGNHCSKLSGVTGVYFNNNEKQFWCWIFGTFFGCMESKMEQIISTFTLGTKKTFVRIN